MKTILLIEHRRTQLVLQSESLHDEQVLKVLERLPNTHRVEFYHARGGWTQSTRPDLDGLGNDRRQDLAIVFDVSVSDQSETVLPT